MGQKDVFKVGDIVYLGGDAEHANRPEFWAKVTGIIENDLILYEISFQGSVELKLPAGLIERVPDIRATLNDINTIFRLTHPINDEIERLEMIDKGEVEEMEDLEIHLGNDDEDQYYDPNDR